MPKTEFKLYTLHEQLGLLFDLIDDDAAPITPEEIGARIKAIYADQSEMLEDVRKAALNYGAQAKAADEEIARLRTLKERSTTHQERMKNLIFQTLEMSGLKKVEFKDGGSARIQANGQPSVIFTGNPEELPEAFRNVKVEYSPKREAILSANDMGLPLPAGVSVVKGSHLRLG